MRKLPIILTLLLAAAWVYTSWYWYTCNIKWFCAWEAPYTSVETPKTVLDSSSFVQVDESKIDTENENTIDNEALTWATVSAPRLSAEDVLFDPLPKEKAEINQREWAESTSTWSEITPDITVEVLSNNEESICENPLIWPISLWWENKSKEVEQLETFLVSRGARLSIDGNYDEADSEAVKEFQLEYKADVLDPWGITTPTGYVWKTTIKKINEIACQ